jgi:hypothetical protein
LDGDCKTAAERPAFLWLLVGWGPASRGVHNSNNIDRTRMDAVRHEKGRSGYDKLPRTFDLSGPAAVGEASQTFHGRHYHLDHAFGCRGVIFSNKIVDEG